jgi:two-component system, OmpR family, sensor kinase
VIRAWLGRAPFALQVGALILLTLVAAQVMMVAVVLIMQPPRPVFYPLSDIAGRLRSDAPTGVTAAGGPPTGDPERLVRQTSAAFSPPSHYRPGHEETSRALAQLLNVADDRVQLFEAGPPFPFSMRRPGPGPGEGRAGDGPRRGRIDVGSRGGGPGGGGVGRFQRPVMGDFVAGLKQMDGSWVTVSSPPEGFPSAWQMRILAWLAGCLIVVAPAGYLFANRITAPLRAFAKAAEQLGRDPRAPLMPLKGPAEIGTAALAFNEMQARIGRYVEDRTAMVGAISHDLRTPLARMRYKLEAAPDGVKDSVLSDVDQMEAMITAVLAFIRDASALQDRRRLDLLSVLEVVSDDAAMMGGDVAIESGEPMTIEADGLVL